ncbi:hypothetical protein QUA56_32660 [Microcoleus sp. N3A4]|uniref:hypothetical protein n=1 Tax=Microcoleus sp. N3A4 TaxID=3055379 RepID=UPI002FD3C1FF
MSSVADSVERIRGFQLRFDEGRSPLWASVGIAVVINLAGKLEGRSRGTQPQQFSINLVCLKG